MYLKTRIRPYFGGRCADFLQVARIQGHPARALDHDTPHLFGAAREISAELTRRRADLLCCHGYKADLVGRIAVDNGPACDRRDGHTRLACRSDRRGALAVGRSGSPRHDSTFGSRAARIDET